MDELDAIDVTMIAEAQGEACPFTEDTLSSVIDFLRGVGLESPYLDHAVLSVVSARQCQVDDAISDLQQG